MALGRKAWLFAGSERGAERAAAIATLIMTAKLNEIDPQAWLADVLARIADHPVQRLDELLPGTGAGSPPDPSSSTRRPDIAAITAVHTLAAVARMLGASEDLLHDLSIEMEPEDGCIAVYGPAEDYTPAFTTDGIERLSELIAEHSQLDLPLDPA